MSEFLDSIPTGARLGVVAVDERLRVRLWNDQAEDTRNLREGEVRGRPLGDLDIGLPVQGMEAPIRALLGGVSRSQ